MPKLAGLEVVREVRARRAVGLAVTIALMLTLAMLAAACLGSPTASVEDAADVAPVADFEPLSLVRDPEFLSVAPLPRPEAERVFRWPGDGRPSLIFVYDDGAT